VHDIHHDQTRPAWKYRRDKDGWTQTGPTGKSTGLTAEQLLSHVLPSLAGLGLPKSAWSQTSARNRGDDPTETSSTSSTHRLN